jgi:energy-coupling factor transporter transmembrane protein EcfT
MASVVELLSRNNPVFSAFVFYATILILKLLAMSALTARQRFKKNVSSLVTIRWWICVHTDWWTSRLHAENFLEIHHFGQVNQNNFSLGIICKYISNSNSRLRGCVCKGAASLLLYTLVCWSRSWKASDRLGVTSQLVINALLAEFEVWLHFSECSIMARLWGWTTGESVFHCTTQTYSIRYSQF